jgi:hypothetical protein
MSREGFAPGRWWKILDAGGHLRCETSNEREAREAMLPGDKLYRIYDRRDSYWELVEEA